MNKFFDKNDVLTVLTREQVKVGDKGYHREQEEHRHDGDGASVRSGFLGLYCVVRHKGIIRVLVMHSHCFAQR